MDRDSLLKKIRKSSGNKQINLTANEIETAVSLLEIEDIKLRFLIGSLIQNKREKSISALINGSNSNITEVRRSSVYLLGKIILKEKLAVTDEIKNVLYKGLSDEDAKVRKNSALVLGDLSESETVDKLIIALDKEAFDWVKKTIMLSLGKIGGEAVKEYFQSYEAKSDIEKETLLKIIDRLSNETYDINFKEKLPQQSVVELWTYIGLEKILIEEIKEKLRLQCNQVDKGIVSVKTDKVFDLMKVRTFIEILFPEKTLKMENIENIESKAIELICNDKFLKNIIDNHIGDFTRIRYRLEIRGVQHAIRKSLIKKIAKSFADYSDKFLNSPTNYDIEIRLIYKNNSLKLLWKPFALKDNRFSYREQDVPASINPVVAAGIVRMINNESDKADFVLDPFCGSGTLLIENAIENKHKEILGVDISDKAINAAKQNAIASGYENIKLIHSDFRKASLSQKYDRIITNMPFGIRVGDHTNNEILYDDFFCMIPGMIKPEGVVAIFTQEISLSKKLIQKYSKHFDLIRFTRLDVGGLKPAVFLLRRQ